MDCFFCNQTGSKLQPNKSVAPSFSGRDQLFTVSIIPHTKIFVQIYPEFLHPGGPLVARLCQPSTDFFPQCSRFPYCHPQPRGPLQDFANHPQISFPNAGIFSKKFEIFSDSTKRAHWQGKHPLELMEFYLGCFE
jgi:hypothetical protein